MLPPAFVYTVSKCTVFHSHILLLGFSHKMAKKNKDQEPKATLSGVTNRDILQRLNFLYQASTYLNTIAPHAATIGPPNEGMTQQGAAKKAQKSLSRRRRRHPATTSDLSRTYIVAMRAISQKTTVKMCVSHSIVAPALH